VNFKRVKLKRAKQASVLYYPQQLHPFGRKHQKASESSKPILLFPVLRLSDWTDPICGNLWCLKGYLLDLHWSKLFW